MVIINILSNYYKLVKLDIVDFIKEPCWSITFVHVTVALRLGLLRVLFTRIDFTAKLINTVFVCASASTYKPSNNPLVPTPISYKEMAFGIINKIFIVTLVDDL